MSEIGDPFVSFGEDMTYGCSKHMNLADLKAYCENVDEVKNLPLFQNLDFWQKYGQFGNANIYNPMDWEDIKIDSSVESLGQSAEDTAWNDD